MKTKEAWTLVGGLSKPSKMPGWSIGLPAKECKTGGKLQAVKGSVCYDCYVFSLESIGVRVVKFSFFLGRQSWTPEFREKLCVF